MDTGPCQECGLIFDTETLDSDYGCCVSCLEAMALLDEAFEEFYSTICHAMRKDYEWDSIRALFDEGLTENDVIAELMSAEIDDAVMRGITR